MEREHEHDPPQVHPRLQALGHGMICPACREPLIRFTDLFGGDRYRHPNDVCRILEKGVVEAHCIQCGEAFLTSPYSKRRRKTCSTQCYKVFTMIHAATLAEKRESRPKKAKAPSDWLRKRWQRKAVEMDNRWKVA